MRSKPTAPGVVGLLLLLLVWSSGSSAMVSDRVGPQLVSIARAALVAVNKALVTGVVPSRLAPSYEAAIAAHLAEAPERRALLAEHKIVYTGVQTELTPSRLTIAESEATLIATEHTTLDLLANGGDRQAPRTTEYYHDHLFSFTYQKGQWALAAYQLVNATAAQPDTSQLPLDLSIGPSEPLAPPGYPPEATPEQQAGVDRSAIVGYAYTYWRTYNRLYRDFNSGGPRGGDCTNFVSQALRAGGWQDAGGWRWDTSAWWSNALNQSWSWINAHYWLIFTYKQSRGYTARYISDLTPGDILQADFDRDGTIDHSMIVTGKDGGGTIYLTYHNSDTRDRPFWEIYHAYPHARWYGVRLRSKEA